ncbi:MAG: rod shape-determining protein RodA [Candidatus Berkelbacteria bacterium]|nr:rod shape-determining protein RodA [Candidatus Berkelbacteria bacterium]
MFSKIKNFEFTSLVLPILLSAVGIALIYSLSFFSSDNGLALKQLIFLALGLFFLILITTFDYRILASANWYLYLIAILLLILVDLIGKTSGGATRWIDLKIFQLQPSEIYKFVSVIFLATFFSKRIGRTRNVDIIYMFLMLLVPLYLVLRQPDLGTALVIIFTWFTVLFFLKLSAKQYLATIVLVLGLATVFFLSAYNIKPFNKLLKDYQRSRITVFLNPASDPFGRGYNVAQAQIAIGSGRIFGSGLGHGSQSQLQFLPKPETDFIFSAFSEAFGIVGVALLLFIYSYFISKIIDIAHLSKDNFGYLLAVGVGATFFIQIIINVGMNIGVMPVTGIPLPFLSYGGSSLMSSFIMIGILQNVFIHRKKLTF